jgi:hypothetical protein
MTADAELEERGRGCARVVRTAVALSVCLLVVSVLGRFASAEPRWPHGDPNVVVRSILAQPAYREAPKPSAPAESLLARVFRWIGDRLHAIFDRFGVGSAVASSGKVVGWLLLVAALVALANVAYRFALLFAGNRAGRSTRVAQSDLTAPSTSSALRAAAVAAAERSDYARAIVLLFRAALAALDERALVSYDAARTPREYRRVVGRTVSAAAVPFDELTSRFVRASFAEAATSRADYDAAAGAFDVFEPRVSAS